MSGLPFTSERQLTGTGPAEASATIVQRTLAELGVAGEVLLWNAVPTHPGTAGSNRPPTPAELEAGRRFLDAVAAGRRTVAVGRVAHSVLGGAYVRHPSRGGATRFREQLRETLCSSEHEPGFDPSSEWYPVRAGGEYPPTAPSSLRP